jgi:hypothetical protein
MDWIELPLEPRHLGVPTGASKMISEPMVHSAQTMHLSNELSQHPLEIHHLGVLLGAFKMISEPTVCLAQTMHLSCTDPNTISKLTKMRFHMTHVTLKFHRVHPKWFLGLWFVHHKPCTYLVSRLALSLSGPNWGSTWSSSSRSTIWCVQNDCWACGTFGANRAPILRQV